MAARPLKGFFRPRHSDGVTGIFALILALASLLSAESGDPAQIEAVLAALSDSAHPAGLFASTADPDAELAKLQGLNRPAASTRLLIGMNEPWAVLTPRHVVVDSIRFLGNNAAVVRAASVVERAMVVRPRVALRIRMRREEDRWRIASIHVLP